MGKTCLTFHVLKIFNAICFRTKHGKALRLSAVSRFLMLYVSGPNTAKHRDYPQWTWRTSLTNLVECLSMAPSKE